MNYLRNTATSRFGAFMALFYAFLFGVMTAVRDSGRVAIALIGAAVCVALLLVRPGWNVVPRRIDALISLLFAALAASALLAALGLALCGIATPYHTLRIDIAATMPAVLGVTAVEELAFRQIAYRWLEQRMVSERGVVAVTSLAWAVGHLGGLLTPGYTTFVLLQSAYLAWVGILLGEIRRRSASWTLAWAGHAVYNLGFLYVYGLIV